VKAYCPVTDLQAGLCAVRSVSTLPMQISSEKSGQPACCGRATGKQEVIPSNSSGNWRLALVVQKGVCGDFILCGLSPPVSPSCPLVHGYTFWHSF
jgi:hypothetical protein